MALLSEFFVSKPDDAVRYDADIKPPAAERAEYNGLTHQEMADLWAVLQNVEVEPAHVDAFESVLVVDGGSRLINRFPPDFVDLLASLNAAAASAAAAKWVQTGELAYLECKASDALPIIKSLSRLARTAKRTGKSLYLWMCV